MKLTIEQIRRAINMGLIKFVVDPNLESGTVCSIGEYWFYFGGEAAEQEFPDTFLANADMDEVARDISESIDALKQISPDEHQYYISYVLEGLASPKEYDTLVCSAVKKDPLAFVDILKGQAEVADKGECKSQDFALLLREAACVIANLLLTEEDWHKAAKKELGQ